MGLVYNRWYTTYVHGIHTRVRVRVASSDLSFSAMNPLLDRNKSSPLPLGKVCIVLYYNNYYAVFIVDLASSDGDGDRDGDGFISTAPTLLIDRYNMPECGGIYIFCVLQSRLYMFEDGGKSAYTYDLYPHLISDDQSKPSTVKRFDKSMLTALDDMSCCKHLIQCAPTPDGKKIIVFSTRFFFHELTRSKFPRPPPIDFELYYHLTYNQNKKAKPCQKLPSLQQYLLLQGYPPLDFFVESFSFMKGSVFLIQTDCFGIFTLNIDDPMGGWQSMPTFAGSLYFPFGRPFDSRFFLIEDDKLCIDGFAAYDISSHGAELFNPENGFWFPELLCTDGFPGITDVGYEHHIIYTQGEEEESGKLYGTVRLVTGIQESTEYAQMGLEVLCFKLDKYREDKKNTEGAGARLEITLMKSLKFLFGGEKCFHFDPVCLFPIAAYSRNAE